jgi:Terminase small subunit
MKKRKKLKSKKKEQVSSLQLERVIEELAAGFTVSSALVRANIRFTSSHQRLNELKEEFRWFSKRLPERMSEAAAERVISQEAVLNEIAAIGHSDPADYYHDDGRPKKLDEIPPHARRALKRMRSETDNNGKTRVTEIELHPKMDALTQMGRYFSLFTDRVDHMGGPNIKEDSDAKLIARFIELGRKAGIPEDQLGVGTKVIDATPVDVVSRGGAAGA